MATETPTSRDVLPIEADRKQPKAFITVRASENTGEVRGIGVGKTENGKSSD